MGVIPDPLESMETATYLQHLRTDGDALAAAAEKDLTAHVPSCPEWNVAELVRHTSEVHRHKAAIVRLGETQDPPRWPEREQGPEDPTEIIDWYRAGLDDLHGLLSSVDPDQPAATWGTGNTAGWWIRRMAQETAVHRWDAQNAVGTADAIDPDLACDGVDEFFCEFVPGEAVPWDGGNSTVHLHSTDSEGEWTVGLRTGEVPIYETGHSKGDAALRGGASDLLLVVWRRLEPDAVEVLGDTDLANKFWEYLRGPGQ